MLDFDIWTIVFSVINILVLFFFLKKFLFGRVGAMLEKRAQMVQADMNQAKQKAAEAEKLRSDYEETLNGAKQEAKQNHCHRRTERTRPGQRDHSQGTAAGRYAPQRGTEGDRAGAPADTGRRSGEIADLALAAASKLMEQKVDDQTNRDLVNAFLSEEGAEK